MTMKTCFKCNVEKPLSEFYAHPKMADGHLNKCKECAKGDVKKNYVDKRPEKSAYDKKRQDCPRRREAKMDYRNRHKAKHPERAKARNAVSNALRDGKITRQSCVHCGSPKSQAHHSDYLKPLEVTWACFKCHREHEHGQVVTQANYVAGN